MGDGLHTLTATVSDAAGNISQASTALTLTIDTGTPSLAIALGSSALGVGQTTTVTFTFTEAPTGFAIDDITVDKGSLSNLAVVPGSGGLVYTATLTPADDVAADNNRISASSGWSDAAGNAPVSSFASGVYSIDTRRSSGNGAPVLGGGAPEQTSTDAAAVKPFAGFTVVDSNAAQAQTVVVKLRDAHGTVGDATGGFTAGSLTASGFVKIATGTYSLVAANAAAAQGALRQLEFQPAANHVAPGMVETSGFIVSVTDAGGLFATDSTTSVKVTSVNDRPTLAKALGTANVNQGQALSFTIPAGTFADPDAGDALTFSATRLDGSALPAWLRFDGATGTLSGTPANGDVGTQVVRVTATDRAGASVSDVLVIQVADINDAPVAANDTATTTNLTPLSVLAASGVLANDSDPDAGDRPVVTAVNGEAANVGRPITLAGGGKLTLSADGRYVFDPAGAYGRLRLGQTATETVSYTITDRAGAAATATLALTVTGTNTAPTAQETKTVAIDQNAARVGLSIDKPVDAEGDPLTVTVTGVPTIGTLQTYDGTVLKAGDTLTPDQLAAVVYTPPFGGTGSAGSFTYTVSDGTSTVTRAVAISVTPVQWLSLSPSVAVAAEGNGGFTAMAFTVTRRGDTSGSTTVTWQVDAAADSGLIAGPNTGLTDKADFGGALPGGAITFAAGETSKTVTVLVSGDRTAELTELYKLEIVGSQTSVAGARIEVENRSAIGTILNDDAAATVRAVAGPSAGRYFAARGGVLEFTVTFTDPVTVDATNGVPRLALTIGSTVRYAAYDRSAGGALVFRYAVAGGDLDTDGITVGGAIDLNGGRIIDSAGNTVTDLTLNRVAATDKVLVNVRGGRAIDGYIAGATVFVDANGNGVQDAGEASGTTDGVGNWSVNGGTGPIVMVGGTDISTNLAFAGIYEAPATASVINPLTTVIMGMVGFSATDAQIATAMSDLKGKLGLDGGLDLLNYDPIVAATATSADAAAVAIALKTQAAAASVANLIVQGSAVLGGVVTGSAPGTGVIGQALVRAVGNAVTALPSGGRLDLSDRGVLTAILTAAAGKLTGAGVAIDTARLSQVLGDAAKVIAASNGAVSSVDTGGGNGIAALTQITQAQVVAQGTATSELTSGAASGNLSGAVDAFTGGNLTQKISEAPVAVVVPSRLSIAAAADKREGDSGTTAFTFTVTRSGNTAGALSVNWSVTAAGGVTTLDAGDFSGYGNALPSGRVDFADGETAKTITVLVAGDTAIESDETFTVTLSSPSVAATAIDTATADGVIRNEDPINPQVTLPAVPTVVAGRAAAITGLRVADGDSAAVTATLTPANGTIALAASGSAVVGMVNGVTTITGGVADVNATLASLVFTGTAGQTAGSIAVTFDDDDPSTPLSAGTLAIAIQSPPDVVLPSRPTVIAGVSTEVLGLEIKDDDGGTMTVVVTANAGTVTLPLFGQATATDLGNGAVRLSGTLDDVNKTLQQLEFTAARQVTGAWIQLDVSDDQLLTADTSGRLVMDVLSPPEQTVPGSLAAVAGTAVRVSGLTVSDFDSATVQVTLTPTGGTLALAAQGGLSLTDLGNGAWRLLGSQTDIAATLATLTFTGTAGQTGGTITVASTDLDGRTPVVTGRIAVTIDNTPTVTLPAPVGVVAGIPAGLAGLGVSDPNGRVLAVTLTATGGTLAVAAAAGVTAVTNQDGSLTLTGLAGSLNTALAAVTFTGAAGTAQAALSATVDAGGGQTARASAGFAMTAAPALTLPAAPTLLDGLSAAVGGIALSNTGSTVATLRLTPSGATLALNAADGAQVADLGNGTFAVVGTSTAINAALASLAVTPATPDLAASVALAVDYAGGALPSLGGTLTVGVIHPPTLTLPQPVTVDPGQSTLLGGLSVGDLDGGRLTVTLTPTQAVLGAAASGSATVSSAPNGTLTIAGSAADVNATLAGLTVAAARASSATIAVTVSDGSAAPPATGTLTLPVVDRIAPDAPVIAGAFAGGAALSGLTNRNALVLRGTAEAGSTVILSDKDTAVATVTAGADGAWSADLRTAPLADGTHRFTATATDAAGNTGAASAALSLTVDATAPAAARVAFTDTDIDRTRQTAASFTISGGEVGTTYRWTLASSGGGTLTGTGRIATAADRIGGLDLTGLPDGALTLSVTLTDDAGNISAPTTAAAAKNTAVVIDGVPVWTLSGQTNGKTTSTVVVQAPTGARVDDPASADSALADVPVTQEIRNGSTVTTLQVSLPTNLGVTASGPAERQSPSQSLDDVIRAIQARTVAGTPSRTGLEGGGRSFLGVLPPTASLLVRTFDFTAEAAPGGTARITGGVPDRSLPTALVIDTRAVGAPLAIQIDNVDFAAVIGDATLTGGAGNQVVFGDASRQYLLLGEGDDYLSGGGGNDTVASTLGNDTLLGDDGDDLLGGGEGNDLMNGGADQDTLGGGAGDDTLGGGSGNDLLAGEDGADVLFGEDGSDTLFGGAGNDTLSLGAGSDIADGGTGDDVLFGEDGSDTLFGGAGNDTLSLGAGSDIADGGDGADVLFGEDGSDTLFGGAGNDTLSLGAGSDIAAGGDGDDVLFGEDGSDTLFGGAGNDAMAGGMGDDLIFLDGGADRVWGGEGADVFAFGANSDGSVVMDFTAGTDRLAFYDTTLNLNSVLASARIVNGSTVLELKAGVSVTILGQTGDAAKWFA